MGNHTSISATEQAQPIQGQDCDLLREGTDSQTDPRLSDSEVYRLKQAQNPFNTKQVPRRSSSLTRRGNSLKKHKPVHQKRNFLRRKKYVPSRQPLTQSEKEFLAAAGRGDIETVQELLDGGVGIETADANEMTALHHAAKHAREWVIKFLVDRGADVNASDLTGGFSPLHWVIINSSPQMSSTNHVDESVIALARGGCNMNAKDFNLATPLHIAAQKGNKSTIDTLVRLGSSPHSVDITGRNCLQVAKSDEVREIMETLHEKKESVVYHVLEVPSATPSPPTTPPPSRKQFQGSLSSLSRNSLSPSPSADISLLRTLPKFGQMPSPNYPAPPPPRPSSPDYCDIESPVKLHPVPFPPAHVPSPLYRYNRTHSPPIPPVLPPRIYVRRVSRTPSPSSSSRHRRRYH